MPTEDHTVHKEPPNVAGFCLYIYRINVFADKSMLQRKLDLKRRGHQSPGLELMTLCKITHLKSVELANPLFARGKTYAVKNHLGFWVRP